MVSIDQMEYTFVYGDFHNFDSGTPGGYNWYSGVKEVVKGPTKPVPKLQQFPGFLDRGTPLVVRENHKNTIAGIFRENLDQNARGPTIFDRLYPEIVNWIIDNSDWAVDSSCHTFTSCSCGQQTPDGEPSDQTLRHSNRIIIEKNTEAVDVPSGKYPWEAIVFNAKHGYCDNTAQSDLFKHARPDGESFDICSSSLITDRHIITSAACILQNRHDMESIARNPFLFTKASCLYASVGIIDWFDAVNKGKILEVQDRYLHEEAFTHMYNFNYNIGIDQCSIKIHTMFLDPISNAYCVC